MTARDAAAEPGSELNALVSFARTVPGNTLIPATARSIVALADKTAPEGESSRLRTTADLAAKYVVSRATARAWLAGGHVAGARRLGRLGWRWNAVGLATLDAYLNRLDAADLSTWRKTKAA